MAEERLKVSRYRWLPGPLGTAQRLVLGAITLLGGLFTLELYAYLGQAVYREQYLGLFLALILVGVFLSVPANRRAPPERLPWYDLLFAILGLVAGLYVAIQYPALVYTQAFVTPDKWLLGGIAILLLLEATRRVVGWSLVVIVAAFILYAHFSYLLPGIFYARGQGWGRVATYLYLDTNGLLGLVFWVAAAIVLPYVLLGQALFQTGGGRFFTDLALALMGRFRGGPAKMAVVASSLFGTISGNAVSNVVSTGIVTIPLMKGQGYRPHVAGAVEAVASTGGQIMPPVMGAAAFLMAELLEVPYPSVVIAAVIPALLYYVTLFVQVDLEAARHGLRGLARTEVPRARDVLRRGWVFLLPLVVLLYALFGLSFQAGKAGMAAVLAVLLLALVTPGARLTWPGLGQILVETGRGVLDVGIITGVAGFVIGVLNLSGLGFALSLGLVQVGGESLLLLLLLAAVVSIILGMGMPTVAVYILLAVLVAPALTRLGVDPMAAHLFIFYFGLMSLVTPPVCVATYAAAALAGANMWQTGLEAVRLGIVAYIVPFLFVYAPALLMKGPPWQVALAVGTAVAGAGLLGVAMSGFLFRPLPAWKRVALGAGAVGLLIPVGVGGALGWISDLVGVGLVLPLVALEWLQKTHGARRPGGWLSEATRETGETARPGGGGASAAPGSS
ncbi:MAG: TRAP transporter fused permease subunit [Deltaproteobacteria bacterium]|nr:TRAP transporter fused permease subunit [Deltaproteobacteria bacterium]